MNIRQAILSAADSIEQNPNIYDFKSVHVPPCDSPGCIIGLVGYHFGVDVGECNVRACNEVFGLENTGVLYQRMHDLDGYDWMSKPSAAVKALRLYADKYHPVKHTGIPDSVLAIVNNFETGFMTKVQAE